MLKIFRKYSAFTLSEVLITLGIIGVIAALTIPALMQKKQELATVSSVKKAYSVLASAYTLAVQENGDPTNWNLTGQWSGPGASNLLNILAPYLKLTKNCANSTGCLPVYKYLDGTNNNFALDTYANYAKGQLADGSLITVLIWNASCAENAGSDLSLSSTCANVGIDINGMNGPNTMGKDYFRFWFTKYGVVPEGTSTVYSDHYDFGGGCKSGDGEGCTAWVLYNENMDYLKSCKSSLSWSGNKSCN